MVLRFQKNDEIGKDFGSQQTAPIGHPSHKAHLHTKKAVLIALKNTARSRPTTSNSAPRVSGDKV
jgi:hypothetical protein